MSSVTKHAAALLSTVVLLGACGGGPGDSATAAPSSTTTTTVKTATVSQVASLVAPHQDEILANLDKGQPCFILIAPEDCDLVASISIVSASIQTETLEIGLRAVSEDSPNNSFYRGTLPDELTGLVSETLGHLDAFQAASEERTASCSDVASPACAQASLKASFAASSVENDLKSWGPYL